MKEKLALADMTKPSEKTLDEDVPFTLRLWDLGGQNDFLTTHHLFLDTEATTVIVMDITKKFDETFVIRDKDLMLKRCNPRTPKEILHYWLNTFYTEAKKKEKKIGKMMFPNILIVLTHINDAIDVKEEDEWMRIREERIHSYKEDILKAVALKDYGCLIDEDKIFSVDNKTRSEESFTEIRNHLLKSFSQQKTWSIEMPDKWLAFQADILDGTESQKSEVRNI